MLSFMAKKDFAREIILVDSVQSHVSQRESTDRRGEGNMTTKAEIGVIWPQIKSCQLSTEAGRGKEQIFSSTSRGIVALLIP